jgi:nucleoside-diphosphate-sugar epimerase
MYSLINIRQNRRGIFISIAVALSLYLIYALSFTTGSHHLASSTRQWGKDRLSGLAPQLYEYDRELQVPLDDDRNKKDPCLEVPLPEGGMDPKETKGTLVLITGGGGFIGSNLADRLLQLGYRVRILDNLYTGFIRNVPLHKKDLEFIYGDILDSEVLKEAVQDVEYIFHLAAMSKVLPSMKDPEMARFCTENNALGTWNVLNATRGNKVKKVVYAGSSTYYGNRPIPHQEDMAPDFLTPYAASKYEGEMQMQIFDKVFDVPTIVNRFFMVYGPRQPTSGAYAIVTGVFAQQAADGRPLTIEGDGGHFRDFIHVQDIIKGLILSQQTAGLRGGTPINLGSGSYFTVKDVADMVSKVQTHVAERKNDLVGTLADTCRMKRLLNYETKMDFKKEMGYMARQTIKGNIFAQEWVTPLHALSAPHILPVGSLTLPWGNNSLLKVVLKSFAGYEKLATEAHQSTDPELLQTITIIPFHGEEDDVEIQSTLLLNTVYSLVRFGGARRYVVAADSTYLQACQEMNLPCVQAKASEVLLKVAELLDTHERVHIGGLGTTYVRPILDVFDGEADITGAGVRGDVFIRTSMRTRSAIRRWSTKAISAVNAGPGFPWDLKEFAEVESGLKIVTLDVKSICPSTLDATQWLNGPCSGGALVTLSCVNGDEKITARSKIQALKETDLWQLSECTNGKYCSKQQNIPVRWLRHPPDLSTVEPWC